jgi:GT2 family glycosyltransferase
MEKIKIAALIVSHNNPKLTDSLVESIKAQTKAAHVDIYVIETGSDKDKCSKYTTIWVDEGIRMTRGWNTIKDFADRLDDYFAYHLFVNDAKLLKGEDMISSLAFDMQKNKDMGYIHPYQTVEQLACKLLNKQGDDIRKVSFAEIVCPMIRKEMWDKIGNDFLDRRFFYGWGLDYDHPKLVHDSGYRMYISDKVGLEHVAYTSYRDGADKLTQEGFKHLAHSDMILGLTAKYGKNWKQVILDSIPEDVSKEALKNWLINA